MKFHERLKELREDRDLTQKSLAEFLGVSPRMVSYYESGSHFVSDADQLYRLADFFGVTTDYLLGYSDIRSVDQLLRLNRLLESLPSGERKSVFDYAAFLSSRGKTSGNP